MMWYALMQAFNHPVDSQGVRVLLDVLHVLCCRSFEVTALLLLLSLPPLPAAAIS
jgi:hypothetical protein